MRHAVTLDAHRRVAQKGIIRGPLGKIRTPRAHHHRHQVDGDCVEQTELQALSGDGAGRHGYGSLSGDGLGFRDRGGHSFGDKVERGPVWASTQSVGTE